MLWANLTSAEFGGLDLEDAIIYMYVFKMLMYKNIKYTVLKNERVTSRPLQAFLFP